MVTDGQWSALDVKVNGLDMLEDVKRQFLFAPQGLENAARNAMNHALNAVRAEGTRMAREKYTAKARAVRASARIKRATAKVIEGYVDFSGKVGIPISEFETRPRSMPNWKGVDPRKRQPAEGVQVRILKGGPFSVVAAPGGEKSFFGPWKGFMNVWYRDRASKAPARKWVKNMHLYSHLVEKKGREWMRKRWRGYMHPLFGPSPIQALSSGEAGERLAVYGQDDFRSQLANQVRQLFRKGAA